MKLYYSPASPYARKTRVLIRELDLLGRVQEVVADPFANDAEFLAVNPLGKIPCLVTDAGESIFDSDVIAAYLDSLSGRASVFASGEQRWSLETLNSLGAGLLDSAVALRVEKTKPAEQQSPLWGERHRNAITRGLNYLEARWASVPTGINAVSLVSACVLSYLDFRHAEIDWRTNNPQLAAWYAEFNARPSLRETAPV